MIAHGFFPTRAPNVTRSAPITARGQIRLSTTCLPTCSSSLAALVGIAKANRSRGFEECEPNWREMAEAFGAAGLKDEAGRSPAAKSSERAWRMGREQG